MTGFSQIELNTPQIIDALLSMNYRNIMNILICHNLYKHRGGEGETVLKEKAILESEGHKTGLFLKDNRDIDRYNWIQKIIAFLNIPFSVITYKRLRDRLKKERPDVVHIHNIFALLSPSIYFLLHRMTIPIVQTVHNYRFLCLNGLFLNNRGQVCELCKRGNFFNGILHKCYRNSYIQSLGMAVAIYIIRKLVIYRNKINIFITPSKFLKGKLLESGIADRKIEVKPHFVECEKIKPSYKFRNYAVFMGRLSREKGLFTLVKAWKEIPDITLKIVGNGQASEELQDLTVRAGIENVEFLGFKEGDERFEILKRAMFMVFPSECYENMPYAILESFACAVPVIASNIGGLRELIGDGITGLHFQAGNTKDLARKISMLSKDKELLLRMRHNSRRYAEDFFSERIGYKNIIDVYKKAVNNF